MVPSPYAKGRASVPHCEPCVVTVAGIRCRRTSWNLSRTTDSITTMESVSDGRVPILESEECLASRRWKPRHSYSGNGAFAAPPAQS
jgi:hypothetical protein